MAVIGTGSKIIIDYVIRRLYAFSASLKNRLKGLTFAETPLARSPDSTGALSDLKSRPLLKAPCEDGSSFRANLEQSI
jgi:hypothetical protein